MFPNFAGKGDGVFAQKLRKIQDVAAPQTDNNFLKLLKSGAKRNPIANRDRDGVCQPRTITVHHLGPNSLFGLMELSEQGVPVSIPVGEMGVFFQGGIREGHSLWW